MLRETTGVERARPDHWTPAQALAADPRDARLPGEPPEGFRNLLHLREAAERDRWRGLGGLAETRAMLKAVERRAAPSPAGAPGFGPSAAAAQMTRLALRDLQVSLDPALYPPATVGGPALRRRRLTLEALDGPELAADAGAARAAERLRRIEARAFSRLAAGRPVAAARREARRAACAVYRRTLFDEALPALIRIDAHQAFERGARFDRWADETDDMAVEVSHALAPTLRALLGGGRAPGARAAGEAPADGLAEAAAAGLLTVSALARGYAGLARVEPGALLHDERRRAEAVSAWIGGDADLAPCAFALRAEPPLALFLAIEAAAPAAQGGGAGRRLGVLGSALLAETLYAAREASMAEVEDHPELKGALMAAFGQPNPPPALRLIV